MTTLPTPLELQLLGVATLRRSGLSRVERKAAGVLAYLALEGATSRSKLAGFFWPDTIEAKARNNLRQTLHRLRDLAATELLVGDDVLRLGADVGVDVARLELAVFAGKDDEVLRLNGELLAGYDYDDCPEFMDWLVLQRERLAGVQREALARLSEAAQSAGDLRLALRYAQQGLDLDPVSEVAYRRVMRIHALRQDGGAALAVFKRCQQVLERELGLSPLPETLALAQEIKNQRFPLPTEVAPRPALPVAVQRPPVLVGREAEWAQLEAAWAHRQAIFISGPAGVGKSRLLHDFLSAQGEFHCFEGRPGDEDVPYMSLLRANRQLLEQFPDLPLEAWVRAELARLLPELGPVPPPLRSPADKVRFYEAQARFFAVALRLGASTIMLDDLQYCDKECSDAWFYVLQHVAATEKEVHMGFTFRQGELTGERLATLQHSVEARKAVVVELAPLNAEAIAALTDSLLEQAPEGLSAALSRHTGGNPLFVLETLRHLIESGDLTRGVRGPLPLPSHLQPLVSRRLERVSPQAQRVARSAAVAGPDLTPELVAAVLEVHPLDLAQPWAELEAAQVMRGGGFAHDLMAEAARASVPAPIRVLLHRRIAAWLEHAPTEPARVAYHWTAAGEPARAAPWWVKAGEVAALRGSWPDARAAFQRVIATTTVTEAAHQDALYGLGVIQIGFDPADAEQLLLAALPEANRTGHLARVSEIHYQLSQLYCVCGRLSEGLAEIKRAIEQAPADTAANVQAGLWRGLYWIELRSGRLAPAEDAIRAAQRITPQNHWIINEHALLLWHAGRYPEAAQLYEDVVQRLRRTGEAQEALRTWFGGNMAWTYWALGRNAEAVALLDQPFVPPAAPFDEALRLANLSTMLTSLGHYRAALDALTQASGVMRAYPLHLVDVLHRESVIYYRADRFAEALSRLKEALPLARQVGDPYRLSYLLVSVAAAQGQLGDRVAGREAAQEALQLAQSIGFPLTLILAQQGMALIERFSGQPEAALQHAELATQMSRACEMPEQIAQSLLLCALAPEEHGLVHLREALEIGQRYQFPDVVWRAADLLGQHDPQLLSVASQAKTYLRTQSPPGWF